MRWLAIMRSGTSPNTSKPLDSEHSCSSAARNDNECALRLEPVDAMPAKDRSNLPRLDELAHRFVDGACQRLVILLDGHAERPPRCRHAGCRQVRNLEPVPIQRACQQRAA